MTTLTLLAIIAAWGWLLTAGMDAILTEWEKRNGEH